MSTGYLSQQTGSFTIFNKLLVWEKKGLQNYLSLLEFNELKQS